MSSHFSIQTFSNSHIIHCLIVECPFITLSNYQIISLSNYLIIKLSHYQIISLSNYLIISLSHYQIISLSHYQIIKLSNYLITELTHSTPCIHLFNQGDKSRRTIAAPIELTTKIIKKSPRELSAETLSIKPAMAPPA